MAVPGHHTSPARAILSPNTLCESCPKPPDLTAQPIQLGLPVDWTKSVTKFQFPPQNDSFRHDLRTATTLGTECTDHCIEAAIIGRLKCLLIQLGYNKRYK